MPRYWVSLGIENPDATEKEKRFEKKLEELSNHVGGDAFIKYYYVTDDIEEAKKVARKAVAICKKYGFEHVADDISITRQPECPVITLAGLAMSIVQSVEPS